MATKFNNKRIAIVFITAQFMIGGTAFYCTLFDFLLEKLATYMQISGSVRNNLNPSFQIIEAIWLITFRNKLSNDDKCS